MPRGYRPDVAATGTLIGFLFMIAANREREDRLFGVVNVRPQYAAAGPDLDGGRSDKP
jgi:5-deoxy-glucuronate isomerase